MFSRDFDYATSLVLYYVDKEYCEAHPNLLKIIGKKRIIWERALKIAEENGLSHCFSRGLLENGGELPSELLKSIVKQEEMSLIKLKNTLHFISSFFNQEKLSFMFIKLYRGIPYTPRDVDVLVRREQSQQIVSALKKRNVTVRTFDGVETQFEKEGLLKVDLYQGFYYLSMQFLDDELLWKDPRIVDIHGVKCPIPSYEGDFLSLLIHALLGHRYLSLLDFLYAKSLLNRSLNIDELLYQAKKFGWSSAFLTITSTIRSIYQGFYSNSNTKPINFPYVFSPKFILKAFQGFVDMPISSKTKFAFIISTLIDSAFLEYQMIQRSVSIEMPSEIKDLIMKCIYRVRGQSGDRKTFT